MRIELRPLSAGEVLDRTFQLYRARFGMFVGIATVAAAIQTAGSALQSMGGHWVLAHHRNSQIVATWTSFSTLIGLCIALPCLTVIADAMGLAGGALLSLVQLHIPPAQFIIRMREALSSTTFWSGMVKAPVFALLIGMVGAYRGMQVRDSARELGRLTTMAVVQSIFLVILADAFFAVLFEQIDF